MVVFWPFITAFIATIIATPISLIFIRRLGLFDDPKAHKHPAIIHKKPIPRGGGIPLVIGILAGAIVFLPFSKIAIAIYLALIFALAVGILDDKFDISPYLRFVLNIVTAGIVVASGVTISFVTNPFDGILHLNTIFSLSLFGFINIGLSDLVAVVWIIWVMNMLNWSKGVDGQMPGIVVISAVVIGIVSMRYPLTEENTLIAATLSFAIAGSALGFMFYNFYPAKIFPGYGATAVYLALAIVSILSSAKLATAILVMGVPMVDGAFTVARRILTGRSPFWHDNKHLHHLLLNLGIGQRSIALFYWSISGILGTISLLLSSRGKVFAIIMLVVLVGGVLFFLHFALSHKNDKKSV
jgi:UDP-GlcNAc:undecaprenyl-phosphate/decaprenyl-phosphate GlcNAc-1-phosphate transferase